MCINNKRPNSFVKLIELMFTLFQPSIYIHDENYKDYILLIDIYFFIYLI